MPERLLVEVEQEQDGRWIAEVSALSGVLAYGDTRDEAVKRAEALALRVIADRLEHGEPVPTLSALFDAA
jgi:predicted RNase H-like HicB family nuclease